MSRPRRPPDHLDRIVQRLRLAARSLRRAPGFFVAAALTLALGIGLATAVFTVADAMALRRLPVHDQNRIVVLWARSLDGRYDNYPVYDAANFARQSRALRQAAYFAWFGSAPIAIHDGGRVSRLRRALVSGNFFSVLGARAALGRALRPADDSPGAAPVAVLSYDAWQQRYGGDPHVLGRPLALYDGVHTYTIIGVMPPGLDYPAGTEFWASIAPSLPRSAMKYLGFDIVGRLAPGASPADAADQLSAFFTRPHAPVTQHDFRGVAHTLPNLVLGNTKPALVAFAVAAALLLLITCVNVANLLLVRGLGRVREIAVRLALGAGRRTITGQLLTENLLLAAAGGVLGVAVATGAVRLFVAFAPAGTPRLDEIGMSAAALAAAVAITTLAVLVFGLGPAVIASRVDLQDALRSGTRQTGSRRSRLAAGALVAAQVALAVVVLSAAALIARSLVNLERAPLGFDSSHLLVADLAMPANEFDSPATTDAMLEALTPKLQAIPGVLGVSPVVAAPFSGSAAWSGRPAAEGQSAEQASLNPILNIELVGPDYFATMGLPVLRGRAFTSDDRAGAARVIMVSRSAAAYYWPDEDPIGKRLAMGTNGEHMATVVGVVHDTRYHALREAVPSVYYPLAQSVFAAAPTMVVVRTSGPPADVVPALRREIARLVPGLALASASPFHTYLDEPLAEPRLNAFLLALFAAAAVALCAIGLFGTMAAMVRQRTREIGVRMALGATPANLTAMVLRRGLAIAAAGVALGLLGAYAANHLLGALLYGVSPTDGVTLAAVAAAMLGVGLLATLVPARATTRVDAVVALRAEE
ncbi:MAG TPA: ABC transporter permease [Gemmatimonadaceae bacterium]